MKTHLTETSSKQESPHCKFSAYGLRKNPRKSQKFPSFNKRKACSKRSDSSRSLSGQWGKNKKKNPIQCKECVKGFLYERPVSNHDKRMHLVSPRVSDEPRTSSSFSIVRRKRSRTIRSKKNNSLISFDTVHESFSVTETEQEVEVAESLIMLSRGVNCLDVSNLVDDLIYFNPKSFEVESLKRQREKLDHHVKDSSGFDNGFQSNKQKKLELGVSIDKTYREPSSACEAARSFKMEKLKENVGSGFPSDSLGNLSMKKTSESCEFELRKLESKRPSFDDSEMQRQFDLERKPVIDEVESSESSIEELVSTNSDSEMLMETQKKGEHKCRICDKVFPSHQALGGHQTVHRTTKGLVTLKTEERKEILQPYIVPETKTGWKIMELKDVNSSMKHKCSICLRSFVSGQALGGHKKSHRKKTSKNQIWEEGDCS